MPAAGRPAGLALAASLAVTMPSTDAAATEPEPGFAWCLAVLPALAKMEKNELTLPDQGRAEELSKFAKVCKLY